MEPLQIAIWRSSHGDKFYVQWWCWHFLDGYDFNRFGEFKSAGGRLNSPPLAIKLICNSIENVWMLVDYIMLVYRHTTQDVEFSTEALD